MLWHVALILISYILYNSWQKQFVTCDIKSDRSVRGQATGNRKKNPTIDDDLTPPRDAI